MVIDTIANLMIRPRYRPVPISHALAVNMWTTLARMDALDSWFARPEVHAVLARAQSRLAAEGLSGPVYKIVGRRPKKDGSTSAAEESNSSKRSAGLPLSAQAKRRDTWPRRWTATVVETGNVPDIVAGRSKGGPHVFESRTPDYCGDLEMAINEKTSLYDAAIATFSAKSDTIAEEYLEKGEVDPSEIAGLVADGVIVAQLRSDLDYLAIEWNLNQCDQPIPTPIWDSTSWPTGGDYVNDSGQLCSTTHWTVWVSYDEGSTWWIQEEWNVDTCVAAM